MSDEHAMEGGCECSAPMKSRHGRARPLLLSIFLTVVASLASAQSSGTHPDLVFPKTASELSMFSPLAVGIWKPPGEGPFPALIIVHSCAGLKQPLAFWRKEAIKRGYVAFVIDAFTARGASSCRPTAPIPMARGVKDVLDAAAHIRTFPFVDPSKVGMVGFSWGAMAGMLSGSPQYVEAAASGRARLTAAVGLYPACSIPPFGNFPGDDYLRPDLATPTLLLLGGGDTETPPEECVSRLAPLRERNAPVEWHVFPDATHCWDCSDQHQQRWSPPWASGRQVVYLYDSKVTDESVERAFAFLGARLGAAPK